MIVGGSRRSHKKWTHSRGKKVSCRNCATQSFVSRTAEDIPNYIAHREREREREREALRTLHARCTLARTTTINDAAVKCYKTREKKCATTATATTPHLRRRPLSLLIDPIRRTWCSTPRTPRTTSHLPDGHCTSSWKTRSFSATGKQCSAAAIVIIAPRALTLRSMSGMSSLAGCWDRVAFVRCDTAALP